MRVECDVQNISSRQIVDTSSFLEGRKPIIGGRLLGVIFPSGRRVALFAPGHGKSSVQVFVRNTIGIPCLCLGDKSPRSQESDLLLSHGIMGGKLEVERLDHQESREKT
jgi:hypothetical protein